MKSMRAVLCVIAVCATRSAHAQQGETVLIEQRVLLQEQLSPTAAKRRALEEAMAEAVRRVAGVRVNSSVVSTTTEDNTGTGGAYRSIVQLDAAGRATDAHIVSESWETAYTAGIGEQLYYRALFSITVERDVGAPDPGFTVDVSLPQEEYVAHSIDPRRNDELVATVRVSKPSLVYAFSIADDSVTALVPSEFLAPVEAVPTAPFELPDATWRARGLRFRVTWPTNDESQGELLAIVALQEGRSSATKPPKRMSVLEFQQWLVRIPASDRATGFAAYSVRRRPDGR